MNNFSQGLQSRLIFLRHGQSVWNAEKRLAGQADISISEVGREQVLQMRETVHALKPATIVSSDLRRARESAALLDFSVPQIDQRLREANLGQWEGEYIADLPKEQYRAWRMGAFDPPQGETWSGFCERVETVVQEFIAADQCCLIVTHGGVIRAACDRILELSPQQIVPVSPASVTVIDVYDRPRLRVYNMVRVLTHK